MEAPAPPIECTHPDHVPGVSCEDRAVGCRASCRCCMIPRPPAPVECSNPEHVPGVSCEERAVGCALTCICCMGGAAYAAVVESDEEFLLIMPDTRHGQEGFRVGRYTPGQDEWVWDEWPQFHPDLETAKASLGNPELMKKGRDAF